MQVRSKNILSDHTAHKKVTTIQDPTPSFCSLLVNCQSLHGMHREHSSSVITQELVRHAAGCQDICSASKYSICATGASAHCSREAMPSFHGSIGS